ncbi:hypothetical protein TRFO_19983 [Tritrichomonas foetus]|uniref:Uncharacterized protein n=1 Tax=Tritrichomonas foetus TaxID=1144522 RepID=A0A1J4KI31_9EUKA|nr:hypothetical protein TRFO_19983 [Tritrichomonas foetus]|eukprot:OHT10592.1 hypothetical protein TRFO_19983 [Tritrichomonas foetus]
MTLADFATTKTRDYTPGPGSYDVNSYQSIGRTGLKYTVRPKYKEKDPLTCKIDYPKERPGLTPQDKTIGPIIGLREKDRNSDSNVGPNFLPDPKEFFSRSVAIRDRLKDPDNYNNPGPGTYSPGDLSKFVIPQMGGRGEIKLSETNDSPGPAAYSVPRNSIDSPRYTIRPRTDMNPSQTPNPGYAYNNLRVAGCDSPRWHFPRAQNIEEKDRKVPGPGYYDQSPPKSAKLSTKIRPRHKEKKPEFSNVPYENTRRFPETKNRKIGEKFDTNGYWATDNKVPGPSWVPESTVSERRKKGNLKIGEKFKEKDTSLMPGPSDYFPADPGKRSYNSFTMKGPMHRDDWLPKDKCIPGPGQYNIKSENNMPRWSIGDKSRNSSVRSGRRNRERDEQYGEVYSSRSSRNASVRSRGNSESGRNSGRSPRKIHRKKEDLDEVDF